MASEEEVVANLTVLVLLSAFNMGVFCGLDARREGRSFLIWFLIGALLTPFGILIWLFFRSNTPPGTPTGGSAGAAAAKGEPCGMCNKPTQPADAYCRHCGAPRTPEPAAASAGDADAAPNAPPAPASSGGRSSRERRYAVLTQLSRAAARNPDVDLRDLVERAQNARSARDFDTLEEELRKRTSPEDGAR